MFATSGTNANCEQHTLRSNARDQHYLEIFTLRLANPFSAVGASQT